MIRVCVCVMFTREVSFSIQIKKQQQQRKHKSGNIVSNVNFCVYVRNESRVGCHDDVIIKKEENNK